jgi:hypothetical protein
MVMMDFSPSELKKQNRERGKETKKGRTGVKWKSHKGDNQTRDGASEKIGGWVKFVLWVNDIDDILATVPLG